MDDKRPFVIFGVVALLLLIFFIYMQKNGRRYSWSETYEETSKAPYGTFVINQLLEDYFPNEEMQALDKSVGESFGDSITSGNYVFIGEAIYLDSLSLESLENFVFKGGNAFIASKTIPYDLMGDYIYEECYEEIYWNDYYSMEDTLVSLNVFHKDLADSLGYDYKFLEYGSTKPYRWHYIDSIFFCDEEHSLVELGGIDEGYINFVKKEYGDGVFYLHTNPLAFTNLQLLDELGLAYAAKVFSHLEDGPIYWDSYSRTEEEVGRRRNQMEGNGERRASESPLKYLLAQTSLKWAWYLALVLGLLYLLFSSKRKQRVIPVLEENTNTSLEFISTIGRLYFLQNDHRKLSLQKMRLFRNFTRERYKFNVSPTETDFIPKLVARSEVPKEVIEKILLMNKNINGSDFVSEKTMVDFHQVLDLFYKNCK